MSLDATRWATVQTNMKSLDKFLLVMMADRADETHCCFPSIKRLCLDTLMDRKTIMAGLKRLVASGLIRDTGRRKGRTGKVKVYQLMGVLNRHERAKLQAVKNNETDKEIGNSPVQGVITKSDLENAPVTVDKQTHKRNDPVNGMIPCFPSNGAEYGTLNGAVDGTQNLSVESINKPISLKKEKLTKEKQEKEIAEKQKLKTDEETENVKTEKYKGIELTNLPDGLTIQSAKNFIDHRKAIKKPLTQHGFGLYLSALQTCTDCGLNLNQIVDETIDAGWQSVKPAWLKNRLNPPSKLQSYRNTQDDNRPRKELVG